jgi:hypothetical protein
MGACQGERSQIMLARWVQAEPPVLPVQRTLQLYFATHPLIGKINLAAAWFAGILGPLCWAALIILFVSAELSAG